MGTRRPLNGVRKCDGQTNRQPDRQTHIRTFQLIERIGPEGRFYENKSFLEGSDNFERISNFYKTY